MGLFGKGNSKTGGAMNVIRCDEQEYLVWKWRPAGNEANSTHRENSIRWGSSLRVKDGEVAVFVYKQKDGPMQDFIVGPFDQTIKTANFPVLSSIIGLAYGGDTPFQAEVYFINLSGIIQVKFRVPYFDVQDPRYPDMSIPMTVAGTISFRIEDYKGFIKVNRLINFTLEDFKKQIRDVVIRRIKGLMTNVLYQLSCPLVQVERNIDGISDHLAEKLKTDLEDFGVVLRRFDVSAIEPDKEHENWARLQQVTADYVIQSTALNQQNAMKTAQAQSDLNIQNMRDMQAINTENMRETLRVNREESQYAQHLASQSANMGAYGAALQADVLKTAAENLGEMGTMNMGSGGGGMNPAGMMTGMMVGGAMGQQMAGMVGNMGNQMNQQMQQQMNQQMNPQMQQGMAGPPPMPGQQQPQMPPTNVSFLLSINGQQSGPYNFPQMQQLVSMGQLTPQTYVWRQGMPQWACAGQVAELAMLFQPQQPQGCPPPPPPTL